MPLAPLGIGAARLEPCRIGAEYQVDSLGGVKFEGG
jgi:hypothetical protein